MKLSLIINEFVGPDPDTFYRTSNAIPFIYGPTIGLLMGEYDDTHIDIMYKNPEIFPDAPREHDPYDYRMAAEHKYILGRTGWTGSTSCIAIWNKNLKMVNKYINQIVNEFWEMAEIDEDSIISTATGELTNVAELKRTRKIAPLAKPDNDKIDQIRDLHLMPPQQKKIAMAKQGLATHGAKHPWQQQAEQNKLIQPGQKWWAATSESKEYGY